MGHAHPLSLKFLPVFLLVSLALVGCPDLFEAPSASFSAAPEAGVLPLVVQFTDTSDRGSSRITSWHWSFGDGGSSSEQHPVHTYSLAGSFSVSLTVSTCFGSDTATVADFVVAEKSAPEITAWPSASAITYGESLGISTLSGGEASVDGTFSFEEPDTVLEVGTHSVAAIFTPSDAQTYLTVSGVVIVTVNKIVPVVTEWPTSGEIVYGQPLVAAGLSGGAASVAGTFLFADPLATPAAGVYNAGALFMPAEGQHYESVAGIVAVNVNKAVPGVTAWPVASPIVYGQTLACSTLSGGAASASGLFTFAEPALAPAAGSYIAAVAFTPDDASNYLCISGLVAVTVEKAQPIIKAWPTAGTIVYGQKVSASALTGGSASVAGEFSFSQPDFEPNAGVLAAPMTFTPADGNYAVVFGTTPLTVEKFTPEIISWPAAGEITYGMSLASSVLTGGEASVPGVFIWVSPSTLPNAGTWAFSVSFLPADSANIKTAAHDVSVVVNKATPHVLEWPHLSSYNFVYGNRLYSYSLTGGRASVPGSFRFDDEAVIPNAGQYSAPVTFWPYDSSNYVNVSGAISIYVSRASPNIFSWPTPKSIVYGQTLGSCELVGGSASVSGTFRFSSSSYTPHAGNYWATLLFDPDSDNYYAVASMVTVVVLKATPVISEWPIATPITYGQSLVSSTLSGGAASTSGTFAFTAPDTKPDAGTYYASVAFTPSYPADYESVTGTVPVIVNPSEPTITAWPTASPIRQGQALASSTLSGGAASCDGTFAFDRPDFLPTAGVYTAAVTFTPANSGNYNPVSGTTDVTVLRARWYVQSGSSGDGSSWESAMGSIQDAIDAANAAGDGEVWVAAGTYSGTGNPVVTLRAHADVYGGFSGTETELDARDWETYQTTIDGESARRCVVGSSDSSIDGFVIRNGRADNGGGMYNAGSCSPTVSNCVFEDNGSEGWGGGMCNYNGASPLVTNCTFIRNWSTTCGGGMASMFDCFPTVVSCTFSANTCAYEGGGMQNYLSGPTLERCTFDSNSAETGGGLFNSISVPVAYNCLFTHNSAEDGAAMAGESAGGYLMNCTFSGNTAAYGGAIHNIGSALTATNSIFWGDSASVTGNEIYNEPSETDPSTSDVRYSCVQGGHEGDNNISDDPLFTDPANDDFTLQAASPCIDTATHVGAPATDILGAPRPQGDGDDMGAYEY